jgi:hypothetical protein
MPTTIAEFGAMPRNAPVVVAHFPLSTDAPPQELPVPVTAPVLEMLRHWVLAVVMPEIVRSDVEAVPEFER